MAAAPPPVKVLVVDDEDAIVELVGEYLRARGMEVVTASDGDQAVTALQAGDIDVVLTDLRLPVRGGMSLLELIVEDDLPVATVVMTGYGTIDTATQALKLGAADYLLKPVRLREVHQALSAALATARARREQAAQRRELALYEKLLGLDGPIAPQDLVAELAQVVARQLGAALCRAELCEGGTWRTIGPSPQVEGPPLVQAGDGSGPGLRLWAPGEEPSPDAVVRAQRLVEQAVAALARPSGA